MANIVFIADRTEGSSSMSVFYDDGRIHVCDNPDFNGGHYYKSMDTWYEWYALEDVLYYFPNGRSVGPTRLHERYQALYKEHLMEKALLDPST